MIILRFLEKGVTILDGSLVSYISGGKRRIKRRYYPPPFSSVPPLLPSSVSCLWNLKPHWLFLLSVRERVCVCCDLPSLFVLPSAKMWFWIWVQSWLNSLIFECFPCTLSCMVECEPRTGRSRQDLEDKKPEIVRFTSGQLLEEPKSSWYLPIVPPFRFT